MKAATILDTIGGTPHVRINRLFDPAHQVWIKSERGNPGGSIKDRIALAMVEDAERRGLLAPGGTIIEPTSGNTGIALAFVAASRGFLDDVISPAATRPRLARAGPPSGDRDRWPRRAIPAERRRQMGQLCRLGRERPRR